MQLCRSLVPRWMATPEVETRCSKAASRRLVSGGLRVVARAARDLHSRLGGARATVARVSSRRVALAGVALAGRAGAVRKAPPCGGDERRASAAAGVRAELRRVP